MRNSQGRKCLTVLWANDRVVLDYVAYGWRGGRLTGAQGWYKMKLYTVSLTVREVHSARWELALRKFFKEGVMPMDVRRRPELSG